MENVVSKKLLSFFDGKRVLVTGHTGFKGTWLCAILKMAGAKVYGYSLPITKKDQFYTAVNLDIVSYAGDISNFFDIAACIDEVKPEIIFHLAAQSLVLESYENPLATYETNIMGTVNLLESIRKTGGVRSFVNVTTDKVYQNTESGQPFIEDDRLFGYDPYSNSKSCSELVTACYKNCFLSKCNVPISTVRAGNVIGGGDFADNRILPDCVRALQKGEKIIVRNPNSVRPYQHVLDALFAYLLIAYKQYDNISCEGSYNIGAPIESHITTGELATIFCTSWGNNAQWITLNHDSNTKKEAGLLTLNSQKIKQILDWQEVWNVETSIEKTVYLYKKLLSADDLSLQSVQEIMKSQIIDFCESRDILYTL